VPLCKKYWINYKRLKFRFWYYCFARSLDFSVLHTTFVPPLVPSLCIFQTIGFEFPRSGCHKPLILCSFYALPPSAVRYQFSVRNPRQLSLSCWRLRPFLQTAGCTGPTRSASHWWSKTLLQPSNRC
jgi:hypothetical protein